MWTLQASGSDVGGAGERLLGRALGGDRRAGRGHVPRASLRIRRARLPDAEALPERRGGGVRGRPLAGEPRGVRERARGDGEAGGRVGGREVRPDRCGGRGDKRTERSGGRELGEGEGGGGGVEGRDGGEQEGVLERGEEAEGEGRGVLEERRGENPKDAGERVGE